ncbi:hypothetical protein VHUM_03203 [Vanrija humicola]|uniref:NAD-dependent epimerase/dehydratase domain-containing protein n=1 Tax=Vanrija humicola TaxID=5417 RepID=A0A7D8Z1S9_VANHU|nr:hypothetical protein VHUM_03203 [Vanrija humicola]
MPRSILFLGATGYIGSTVLAAILAADKESSSFTVLARNPTVLKGFEAIDSRIKGVQGSLDDHAALSKLASEHDIVFNLADADGVESTKAILRGLKTRHEATGTRPILIHTSGTGVLSDNAAGEYPGTEVFTDAEAEPSANPPLLPISALAPARFHRQVDLEIENADRAGYVYTYIIIPSTIYGISKTVFSDKGLANPQSQQIPHITRFGIERGVPAQFGQGLNLWPNVEVHDLADLYALVYNAAIAGPGDHGENGYYFGASGEHQLKDVYAAIGKELYALKLVSTPEPRTLDKDELKRFTNGSVYLGSNSRARAVHSARLGWKPKNVGNEPFIASIKEDVDWTASHDRGRGADGKFAFGPGPVRVEDGGAGGWTKP